MEQIFDTKIYNTIIFLIIAIFYISIVYVMITYDKSKQEKDLYDINKYIRENFSESYCAKLIVDCNGSFRIVGNYLIYWNSLGVEKSRTQCILNKNRSYFRYTLFDAMEKIENDLKTDISSM